METPATTPTPRVQVGPLLRILVLALLLPVGAAFLADQALGTAPLIVLIAVVVCIPLATTLVSLRALRDLNALIAVVAPPEAEPEEKAEPEEEPEPALDAEEIAEVALPDEQTLIAKENSLPPEQ